MADNIRRAGSQIQLDTEVVRIAQDSDGVLVETREGGDHFDEVLCTLPTRLFVKLAQGLPEDYVGRYAASGEHYSAHCLVLELDRQLQWSYWLNVNDPGYPFLALVEHTNIMPPADYGDRHLVYLGNYLAPDAELFSLTAEEILERYVPHIQRINPRFERSWVQGVHSFSSHYAQPIVRVGYPDTLAPHRTPLKGVWLANMGHVYPQDRGQNYSIALGESIGEAIGGKLV
jgi:protoporphyrinogen oxidase